MCSWVGILISHDPMNSIKENLFFIHLETLSLIKIGEKRQQEKTLTIFMIIH